MSHLVLQVPCVYAPSVILEENTVLTETENATIEHELVPVIANATGHYHHYYDVIYWLSTFYVKRLTYALNDLCGNLVDGPWPMNYSLSDQMVYDGCKCPMCNRG